MDNGNPLGDWSLTIADNAGGDEGLLTYWALEVAVAGAGIPDCNNNGVHDGCELTAANDCNANGILDSCDISSGTSADTDLDGIPDECGGGIEYIAGDANADGSHDISDAVQSLQYLFGGTPVTCEAALNTNGDAQIDVSDVVYLLVFLFDSGANPVGPFPNCGPLAPGGPGCSSFNACP